MLPDPLVTLASWDGARCVSVFCHLTGVQPASDQVFRQVRGRLHELDGDDVDDLIASLERIDPPLSTFPSGASAAVAVYLTPARAAWLALAQLTTESAEIGDHADLLPALSSFIPDVPFFVLSLDQHGPRLYTARRSWMSEVAAPEVGRTIDEVVSTEHRAQSLNADGAGVIHGTFSAADRHKADVRRYVAAVAREVDAVLGGRSDPLVLAGVDYEVAVFREASRYPQIVDGTLRRPARHGSVDEFRSAAWAKVEPRASAGALHAAAQVTALLGTGKALVQPGEIAEAIMVGAVSDVVVSSAITTPLAGSRLQPLTSVRAAQVDALNAAVRAGLPVHLVPADDMPAGVEFAALRRY